MIYPEPYRAAHDPHKQRPATAATLEPMTRVALLHWKPAEAESQVKALESAGCVVAVHAPSGLSEIRAAAREADVVLIDLSRLPMQGQAVAIEVRQRVESRLKPIVFVGGAADKVDRIRGILPDAAFVEWTDLPESLPDAIRRAPKKPVVPDTMAGYSGSPLPKKLGIKEGSVVALVGAPEGFESKLAPLPEGVRFTKKPPEADRIVLFTKSMKDFEKRWATLTANASPNATLWIAWPKRASGIATDVSETVIRGYGLERGWVDYKVCAVDETWSGLAFTRRKKKK